MRLTSFEAEVRVVHPDGSDPFPVRYNGQSLSFGSTDHPLTTDLAQYIIAVLEGAKTLKSDPKWGTLGPPKKADDLGTTSDTPSGDPKRGKGRGGVEKANKAEVPVGPYAMCAECGRGSGNEHAAKCSFDGVVGIAASGGSNLDPLGLTPDGKGDPDQGAATVADEVSKLAAQVHSSPKLNGGAPAANGYNGLVCVKCGAPQRLKDGVATCAEGHKLAGEEEAAYRMREARAAIEAKQVGNKALLDAAKEAVALNEDPIQPDTPVAKYDLVILKGANKLKDIVVHLLENGCAKYDLVKVCESLKPNIPLLNRMGGPLELRIPAVLEIIGEKP